MEGQLHGVRPLIITRTRRQTMPYSFSLQSATGSKLIGRSESFWLYHQFAVAAANGVATVNHGYLAVYFSQPTGAVPELKRIESGSRGNYEIADDAGNKLGIQSALLRESRRLEYSNEVSQLLVFELSGAQRASWINEGSWNFPFRTPKDARTATVSGPRPS
jgi:hypothetical protein